MVRISLLPIFSACAVAYSLEETTDGPVDDAVRKVRGVVQNASSVVVAGAMAGELIAGTGSPVIGAFKGAMAASAINTAITAPAWMMKHFTSAGYPVEFFKNEDVNKVLPLPPNDYPEQLQGMIWMDQAGFYGHSDVPIQMAAPDGVFSFGDVEFDKLQEGSIKVDTHGPAWQWFNSPKGYTFYNMLSRQGFHYNFIFTDNFKHAQIIPSSHLQIGSLEVPPNLINFEMEYQSLYLNETACPRHNTEEIKACLGIDKKDERCQKVKMDVTKCAKWKRPSSILGRDEKRDYYAYEIVDRNGEKREPYYSMYLEWIQMNAAPSAIAAEYTLTGLDQFNSEQVMDPATAFRGVRTMEIKKSDESCEGNWDCKTKACKMGLKFWEGKHCA